MNIYSVGEVTVVVDLAHNESGLDALLEIMHGLRAPGARVMLALGTAGDRNDELLQSLGAIGARGSDVLVIVHKLSYLRGRTTDELERALPGRRGRGRRRRGAGVRLRDRRTHRAGRARASPRRRRPDVPPGPRRGRRVAA